MKVIVSCQKKKKGPNSGIWIHTAKKSDSQEKKKLREILPKEYPNLQPTPIKFSTKKKNPNSRNNMNQVTRNKTILQKI